MDNRVFLKVKLKALAEEARIIRHEERKRFKVRESWVPIRQQRALYLHRISVVRPEARATLAAYMIVRGRAFCERGQRDHIDWDAVGRMVSKYGHQKTDGESLAEWQAAVTREMGEVTVAETMHRSWVSLNRHEASQPRERAPRVHRTREEWEAMKA